jgi:DNA replication protein DnaC
VNNDKITSLHKTTRVSGLSDQELQNVQAQIERARQAKIAQKQTEPERPINAGKVLSFDRAAYMRQLQQISQKRARREENYDGPMSPPPIPAANYTHKCPDCGYMVNQTDTHGYKRSEREHSYDVKEMPCPTCSPAVKRFQNAKKARKYVQDLVHEHIFTDVCNLPDDADGWTFNEFEYLNGADTNARDKMLQFVDGDIKNIFEHGDTGVCKTGLAVAALHELKARGVDCLMLPMKQYLDLLREESGKSKRGEPVSHIKQIARGVEVLLIDDLGVERITETGFAVEETQGLIEDRHSMGLRTIITSNMSLKGLKAYWRMDKYKEYGFQPGDRIVSRIAGWYKVVEVTGVDQRIGE